MQSAESSPHAPGEQAAVSPLPGGPRNKLLHAAIATLAVLLAAVVLTHGGKLWQEWTELRAELHASREHGVVGYMNIAPVASYAERPKDWYRVKGNESYLWFGWERNSGHRWFRFASGEIDPNRLHHPESHFISQAIDFPMVEHGGGKVWERMHAESAVVGFKIENMQCEYPVAVLGKVLVINDIVAEHPYMVVVNPFAKPVVAFSIYDALLDGRRVTLAPTGYFQDGKPVLFDRGTESLWIEMHDGLTAMAGKQFRKRLMRVAIPSPVAWSAWVSRNPDSRLLVGADRSLGIPSE